jgi:hypothetical protein
MAVAKIPRTFVYTVIYPGFSLQNKKRGMTTDNKPEFMPFSFLMNQLFENAILKGMKPKINHSK